ncbi:MAG TPA: hypothetical protein VGR62_13305 [Candidatus Binatia bacterium]|nr:hypothetical protein [Candidatus Binatia bacterium]
MFRHAIVLFVALAAALPTAAGAVTPSFSVRAAALVQTTGGSTVAAVPVE